MTTFIQVSQRDIATGRRGRASRCPVAYAATRELGLVNVNKVIVTPICIHLYLRGQYFTGALPQRARNFIKNFDYSRPVKPFVFTIKFKELKE